MGAKIKGTTINFLARYLIAATLLAGLYAAMIYAHAAGNSAAITSIQDCSDCPTVVIVPPGEFEMGSLDGEPGRPETPIRHIKIGYSFGAGKTPVTNQQYARFIATTQHKSAKGCNFAASGGYQHSLDSDWHDPGYGRPPKDDEPVVCVSWLDAKAYAEWLSQITHHQYRLLTETEWEYAAKAGTTSRFPWGDSTDDACKYANLYDQSATAALKMPFAAAPCNDGFEKVAPVASFPPNQFGLYDMIGNVWQWTEDCYIYEYPAWPADGTAVEVYSACPLRTIRGGSWATTPSRLRPSWRGRDAETMANMIFGFRIARDL